MLRACNLDFEQVVRNIISKYDQPADLLETIEQWYHSHLEMMVLEGKQKKGHLEYLESIVKDLVGLHTSLIEESVDEEYHKLYKQARPALQDLAARMPASTTEVEVALNALYGFLLLKLQNKEISDQTQAGIQKISRMMAHLAGAFRKLEEGIA